MKELKITLTPGEGGVLAGEVATGRDKTGRLAARAFVDKRGLWTIQILGRAPEQKSAFPAENVEAQSGGYSSLARLLEENRVFDVIHLQRRLVFDFCEKGVAECEKSRGKSF